MDSHLFKDLGLTAEVVERQLDRWNALRRAAQEEDGKSPVTAYRFLTIARDEGSLGIETAQVLSKLLGWHLFDNEIVTYIAKNSHVRENLIRQLDERAQNIVQDTISSFLRWAEDDYVGNWEYHESLLKTLACIAHQGAAVIVGRGANFALRENQNGIKVRISASPEVRARRLMQKWNVSEAEARHRVQTDDEEHRKFIRQYYRQDFDDLRFYDIVFNTDHASPERVAAAIYSFLNQSTTVQ
jgi:cytidylate kinase